MPQTIALLDQGHAWTAEQMAAITAEDLTAPTPCPPWNLRHLLDHLLEMLVVIAHAAEGRPLDPGWRDNGALAAVVATSGEAPAAAFEAMAGRLAAAWRRPGALEQTCQLSFGAVPASVVAGIQLLEVVVHGWDITSTVGRPARIPDDLANAVYAFAQGPVVTAKRGIAFADPLDVAHPRSASDRLLAYLGRVPLTSA